MENVVPSLTVSGGIKELDNIVNEAVRSISAQFSAMLEPTGPIGSIINQALEQAIGRAASKLVLAPQLCIG